MMGLIVAVVVLCLPFSASGQGTDPHELSRLFQEAVALEDEGKFPEAETKLQHVLKLYEERKDKKGIADTTTHLARVQLGLSRFKEALSLAEKAEKLHSELKDWKSAGEDITDQARSHNLIGSIDESLRLCKKALKIHEENLNWPAMSKTFRIMSQCYSDLGNFQLAKANADKAYYIANKIGDEVLKGSALMRLGLMYQTNFDLNRALDYFNKAIAIFEKLGKQHLLADVLVNVGGVYSDLGDIQRSIEYYQKANAVFEKNGDRYGVSVAANNTGVCYYRMGEYGKALEAFKTMYEIESQIGSKIGSAQGLNNMAYVLQELGDHEQAMNYFNRALKITEEIGEKNTSISALFGIANSHEYFGRYTAALNIYKRIHQMSSESGYQKDEAESLMKIGVMAWKTGDTKTALEHLTRSASLLENLKLPNPLAENYLWMGELQLESDSIAEAEAALLKSIDLSRKSGYVVALWPALHKLGCVYRITNRKTEAVASFEESIRLIEQSRSELRMAEQKTGFFKSKVDVYEDLVSLLAEMNRPAEAFEYVQRSKARGFVDLLAETRIEPYSDELSPKLKSKKKKIESDLMIVHNQIQQESENSDQTKLKNLIRKRNQLENMHSDLIQEIREKNPHYANVQYPIPLRLKEAQALLDQHSVLLEYYIRKSASLLFAITNNNIQVFQLPEGQTLREQISDLRDAVQKPDPVYESTQKAHSIYVDNAASLYEAILKPAETIIASRKRIILAPDGALSYLPFESLLTARPESAFIDFSLLPYLTRKYEIQYVPSASVLASVRREKRKKRSGSKKELLAFADPQISNSPPKDSQLRSLLRSTSAGLAPLRYAKSEVEEIASLYRSKDVTILVGPEASEKNLKTMELQPYRVLHFASHALIDEERPEFSALILTPDEKGEEDGYLTMREVLDLRLNADLVVLSACKTGLGKQLSGEGVNGISRSFLLAGTPSVVVSLWDVYDRSTADLMTSFYKSMKTGNADKAAAIKKARIELIDSGKFSHPYYWSPFILMGDR